MSVEYITSCRDPYHPYTHPRRDHELAAITTHHPGSDATLMVQASAGLSQGYQSGLSLWETVGMATRMQLDPSSLVKYAARQG
jgi:hypothetical protein